MASGEPIICDGTIPLRERHKAAQEEAILLAAQTLITERGFDATTMDDIAAFANISKPTLYARFPSKEAIVLRAVTRMQKEGLAFMRSLPAEMPPAERLRAVLRRIFTNKYIKRTTSFAAQHTTLTPQLRSNPEYRKYNGEIITELVHIIEEGQRDGSFVPERNARIVAQTMISFVRDSEVVELITSGTVSAEAAIETLTEIILRGIETR